MLFEVLPVPHLTLRESAFYDKLIPAWKAEVDPFQIPVPGAQKNLHHELTDLQAATPCRVVKVLGWSSVYQPRSLLGEVSALVLLPIPWAPYVPIPRSGVLEMGLVRPSFD